MLLQGLVPGPTAGMFPDLGMNSMVASNLIVDAGLMQEDEYKVSKHKISLSLNSLKILSFSFGRF